MGLGKTVQMLAFLQGQYRESVSEPALVICPASLVYNWIEECSRFTPDIPAVVLAGNLSQRKKEIRKIGTERDGWLYITSDHHPKIFKETLYSESMVLILPTGFLTREQLTEMNRTGDLSVLEEVPFVMNTQNDTAGRFGTAILESSHIVPYTAAMSDSAETCLRMCIDGLGAYICPDIYVRFYRDRLKHLSIIPLDYSYQICLARRQELYDKTSIQTFWKCCREMKWQ